MDRIILCGRQDEYPGYLLKRTHNFFPGCDGVYCMKYQHGSAFVWSWLCSNLRLYDIDLHCMSGSYVQVWVLYHMDLRCILIAMLVYSSHGSTLYWSAPINWLLVSMSQHTDVLQMPTWQHALIELTFSPRSDDFFSQISHLSYPSKTHALGGILLYQNLVTIMW